MNYHNKRIGMKIRRSLKKIALTLIFFGITFVSYKVGSGDWLSEVDFQRSKWYECNDPVDSCYFNENINHNTYNKIIYEAEINKRSRLEKKSMRPDLDKNGSVCSYVSYK